MMPAPDSLGVAIHQPAAGVHSPADRLMTLRRHLESIDACELIVCPELFLSGYGAGERFADRAEASAGPFADRVAAFAREFGCTIVYGYPERDDDRLFNSALCIGADGEIIANHRKTLLPHAYEDRYFARGERATIVDVAGWRVGILVCYEVEFPEAVRYCAVQGCDLVVVPTALTTEWTVVARRVVPARAFENNIFVAYANYAGREEGLHYLGESVIVSPLGEDLARADDRETMITARLDHGLINKARERLTFLEDLGHCIYR